MTKAEGKNDENHSSADDPTLRSHGVRVFSHVYGDLKYSIYVRCDILIFMSYESNIEKLCSKFFSGKPFCQFL